MGSYLFSGDKILRTFSYSVMDSGILEIFEFEFTPICNLRGLELIVTECAIENFSNELLVIPCS